MQFRSAGSGTKVVLETGNINEKEFNDNDRHFCQEKEKDMLSIIFSYYESCNKAIYLCNSV